MKILLDTNAPWTFSGYGTQGASLARRLRDDGHNLVYFCNYGLRGGVIQWEGITCLPTAQDDGYTDPIIHGHIRSVQPDLLITLFDAWPLRGKPFPLPGGNRIIPWAAWVPVDHSPLSPANREVLAGVTYPVSMSRHGHDEMDKAGIHNTYIPHGIEKAFHWTASGRKEFRRLLEVPDDAFLFGTVGLHYGYPNRKGTDRLFEALTKVPDAFLYIHGLPEPLRDGMNMEEIVDFYGVKDRVRFADPYNYTMGYSQGGMNALYSALDCYVQPTMGEGFGLPVIEAQACGCPVIVTDCTSMPELVAPGAGILVPGENFLVPDLAHRTIINAGKLAEAMTDMMEWQKGTPNKVAVLRQTVARWANAWDWDKIYKEEWQPFLAEIAKDVARSPKEEWRRGGGLVFERNGRIRKQDSTLKSPAVRKELALLKTLDHPNIIPILADGEDEDGTTWFEMPKFTPLTDIKKPTKKQQESIIKGLRDALSYLHDKGIAHRDVHPDNIVVDASHRPCLIDFEWANPCDGDVCVDIEPWKCPERAVGAAQTGMEDRGLYTVQAYLKDGMEGLKNLRKSKATGFARDGTPYQPLEGMAGAERPCEDRWKIMNPDVKGKSVLDVGCNAGWFVRKSLEDGASRAVGIDRDEPIIDIARSFEGGEYRVMGVHDLDGQLGHFDVAFLLSVLQHVERPCEALKRVTEIADEVFVEIPLRFVDNELAGLLKNAEQIGESERGRPIFKVVR